MFTIEAIMTMDLITIAPSASLAEARALMQDNRIHHLPVVTEDSTLVGLLTLTDVLSATDSSLRDTDSRIRAADICIREVMVSDVITVDARASLRQAALFIERHKIGCLPVISDGKLQGDTELAAWVTELLPDARRAYATARSRAR